MSDHKKRETLLIYALIERGSVLPHTFKQVVDQIRQGKIKPVNEERYKAAQDIMARLRMPP